MTVKLKYIGDGSFFPGVPADDHETDDETAAGLVASGHYAYVEEPEKTSDKAGEKPKKTSDKAGETPAEESKD